MGKQKVKEKKHAKYSASGSYRWIACPGSIKLSEKAPKGLTSSYAEEGTLAHEVFETILREPDQNIPDEFSSEMVSHALEAAKYVWDIANEQKGKILIETEVDNSAISDEMFGTLDVAIVTKETLYITDYKYGAGIPVEPEENYQLLQYALGVASKLKKLPKWLVLTIIQPRAFHTEGPIREWKTLLAPALKKHEALLRKAVKECEKPKPKLHAGDHCRFCPASTICPEVSSKALKQAQVDFDIVTGDVEVLSEDSIKGLTPLETSHILNALEKIEAWGASVREYAFNELNSGATIPGFKLVNKRSTRKWADIEQVTEEAKRRFKEKAFSKPELLSPAQLEKAIKDKDWVNKRVVDVSTGLTLVSEKDKRPAVTSAQLEFDEV